MTKENLIDSGALTPIISRWANASHGLDVLLNPWVLVFGLAVMFLARTLGILYVMNNVADEDIRSRGSVRIIGTSVPFLVLFVAWLVHLLMKDGFAVGDGGAIVMEPFKYAHNLLDMPLLLVLLLIGIVGVLWGIGITVFKNSNKGIWPAGVGGFAEFVDHSELMLFRVYAQHDGRRVVAYTFCSGIYRILLVLT